MQAVSYMGRRGFPQSVLTQRRASVRSLRLLLGTGKDAEGRAPTANHTEYTKEEHYLGR